MNNFKNKHTFDRRVKESQRILEKYPDRFPIIIEKHRKCDFDIDKNKYLVPKDLTVGQLIFVIIYLLIGQLNLKICLKKKCISKEEVS